MTATHFIIPDTQVEPGAATEHLEWAGRYIVEHGHDKPNVKVIHLGDHWDMPSLSSYDRKGGTLMEGRRYTDDVAAGNEAFRLLSAPLLAHNRGTRGRRRFELHFLFGNHENRIVRAYEQDAQLEGAVSLDHLKTPGWERHGFLEPVCLDGVVYSHYLYNVLTGRPLGGSNLETRLKNVGHSFTVGHTQGLKWARVDTLNGPHIGLQAGSFYQHDPDFLGPQARDYWRGIVVAHEVRDGNYDVMTVSINYLKRRYG